MYTIKRAAELIGVSVSTLRAWERRYGLVEPQRTDSGYRLYDDAAVRSLSVMHSLVLEGWSARQAAEETRRRLESAGSGAPADGRVRAREGEAAEELVQAAEDFDVVTITRVLDERFAGASFESVADGWLMPALCELGAAWESGRVSVAGEHLVTHAVVRRLSAVYDASGTPGLGPRVVVGLPPRARHELGLLAFAVAARRAGLDTTYVGADLPVDAWAAAVEQHRADCVVLAASMPQDVERMLAVVEVLREAHPDVLVAVGGGQQDCAPEGAMRLGHEVGPAARALAHRLRRVTRS